MHSGQSLLLILDPDSLVLRNVHSGQPLLLISNIQSWIYRTYTAGSICSSFWTQSAWFYWIYTVGSLWSSFQNYRAGYIEHALWAVSAPRLVPESLVLINIHSGQHRLLISDLLTPRPRSESQIRIQLTFVKFNWLFQLVTKFQLQLDDRIPTDFLQLNPKISINKVKTTLCPKLYILHR